MKINLEYLEAYCPCSITLDWFVGSFGKDFEFNSMAELIEAIKTLKSQPTMKDLVWIIGSCSRFQTKGMLKYFKSLSFDTFDFCLLLNLCPKFQTMKNLEYLKKLNPTKDQARYVFTNCPEYQTLETIRNFFGENLKLEDRCWVSRTFPKLFRDLKDSKVKLESMGEENEK